MLLCPNTLLLGLRVWQRPLSLPGLDCHSGPCVGIIIWDIRQRGRVLWLWGWSGCIGHANYWQRLQGNRRRIQRRGIEKSRIDVGARGSGQSAVGIVVDMFVVCIFRWAFRGLIDAIARTCISLRSVTYNKGLVYGFQIAINYAPPPTAFAAAFHASFLRRNTSCFSCFLSLASPIGILPCALPKTRL